MAENRGTLDVILRDARSGAIIEGANVILTGDGSRVLTRISDGNGFVTFSILTPPTAASLTPRSRERAYATVNLRIVVAGYVTVFIIGEQIFTNQTTNQTVYMGHQADSPGQTERIIVIPEHHLEESRIDPSAPSRRVLSEAVIPDDVRQVVVPETIRVHLGAPGSNAENVTVPFIDYIKNVASSEIYPTWPESSLVANVIAQVSLALNRLYTEWYPSQGYDFDITNSTAYDQYYVHERGVFEQIDTVVDGYFNNYLARKFHVEPLFAEYCDGATTTCDGMSQWGTVTLARKDYTPLRILQYYYGNEVEIRQAEIAVGPQPESFPGVLQQGDASNSVQMLQTRLNRIAINFPAIPFIRRANGTYDASTALAVRAFQRLFRLEETGVVNRETWYRIQYIYTAVKKLAELGSEGEFPQSDTFSGRTLRSGDRGTEVLRIQHYLAFISQQLGSDVLPRPDTNGIFDTNTEQSVRKFQEYYGLIPTGTINEATWNSIVTSYYALGGGQDDNEEIPYPGTPLRRGSTGADVSWLQTMLNQVAATDPSMPTLAVDGIFGAQTEQSVRQFQSNFGLAVDGVVGPVTWEALTREYNRLVQE